MNINSVGVLLPTRGRYQALENSLISLSESYFSELLEVIIITDNDKKSYEVAKKTCLKFPFGQIYIIPSNKRLYPVRAFNKALKSCFSDIFFWTNDEVTYERDWLQKALKKFLEEFPDLVGVLSLYKKKKAGLGMSSKRFVEVNDGEWFCDGYKLYYPDDELTCRAILLGRYAFSSNSGVFHDIEITKTIPVITPEEKLKQKRIDRGLFYKRSENNFGLDPKRLYEWKGFREINLPLK